MLYLSMTTWKREGIHLGIVMKFVTGAEHQAPFGYGIAPSITFQKNASLLLTAKTCINHLTLQIPTDATFPEDE